MKLPGVLGNERLKSSFEAMKPQSFPHAVLIEGEPNTGKRMIAVLIAAGLVCENAGEQPCMKCEACIKAQKGIHPDVIAVDIVPGAGLTDKIRSIRSEAYILPGEAHKKVYILNYAHKLTPPCQNLLLKVLEEPPKNVCFILVCENSSMLLPTVRSRLAEFATAPVERHEIEEYLRKIYPAIPDEDISKAAALSGGAIGRADAIIASKNKPDERLLLINKFCRAVCSASFFEALEGIKMLDGMTCAEAKVFFEDMRALIRDAVFICNGMEDMCFSFAADGAAAFSEYYSEYQLKCMGDIFTMLSERCRFNANITSLMGVLAAQISNVREGKGLLSYI